MPGPHYSFAPPAESSGLRKAVRDPADRNWPVTCSFPSRHLVQIRLVVRDVNKVLRYVRSAQLSDSIVIGSLLGD
ncbi:hypothetical protein PENSUB_2712 [Penicillium subrubescens]|uniref:Uncharacterized protein n=1 Tax=Penicillium subrubescens TaxID=1316194 RepID=A0A1Q5UGL9_9EURO|nr:hypothetical protein PENSUB_2712 [Penicillium subrubescens]